MSYARWSEGDIYVYLTGKDAPAPPEERYYMCQCCCAATNTLAIIGHVQEHIAKGDRVPDRCLHDLERDRDENDRWIATGLDDYDPPSVHDHPST